MIEKSIPHDQCFLIKVPQKIFVLQGFNREFLDCNINFSPLSFVNISVAVMSYSPQFEITSPFQCEAQASFHRLWCEMSVLSLWVISHHVWSSTGCVLGLLIREEYNRIGYGLVKVSPLVTIPGKQHCKRSPWDAQHCSKCRQQDYQSYVSWICGNH